MVSPTIKCQLGASGEECSSGNRCLFLHSLRDCRYWMNGFCRRSSDQCWFKHDPSRAISGMTTIDSEVSSNKLSNSFLGHSLMRTITTEINTAINKLNSFPSPQIKQPRPQIQQLGHQEQTQPLLTSPKYPSPRINSQGRFPASWNSV